MTSQARAADYACAIILQDNKVLLGRRAHFRAAYPNCWDFIGGRVEVGESHEQALTRELGEELAITPLSPQPFETLIDTQMSAENPPSYHFFIVTDWSGTPHIANHEHSHLEWFTLQQACDLSNLALPAYRSLLTRALA